MNKKSFSREKSEREEGLPQVSNDVPENKMQGTQQVQTSADAEKVEAPKSGFQSEKVSGKGSELKQQKVSDLITGSSGSSGMGFSAGGRNVSGTGGGVLGAANSTPVAGKSRSDSRVGKKLDRPATKMLYTPAEQALLTVDESKPLADAADEDQGYNGTYRNEFARSQKVAGAVPADLLFQRSVDLITKDRLYFAEGQLVYALDNFSSNAFTAARAASNPTKCWDADRLEYRNYEALSGDYLHRNMHIQLTPEGLVETLYFDVEDCTPHVNQEDANSAAANRLILDHRAELNRMVMDSKAGDEKADIWTPLARAVEEPTQTVYLLSSIEAETGAYVYLAYSKATTNMSYQLNRASKDGLTTITPGVEELIGWRSTAQSSTDYASYTNMASLFNDENYALGDSSIMIAAYDSIAKYNNKADLLLQPRGFRMHLQTADNHMNPFYVDPNFCNAFAATEAYSTIDHEYDPLLPICMTDKANVILAHNLNELGGFTSVKKITVEWTGSVINDGYKYTVERFVDLDALRALGYTTVKIAYTKSDGFDAPVFSDGVISFDPDSENGLRQYVFNVYLDDETPGASETTLTTITLASAAYHDVVINVPKVQDQGEVGHKTTITDVECNVDRLKKAEHIKAGCFIYAYSDLRNNYTVTVKHPLVEGIKKYLEESIGPKFYSLLKGKELFVPMIFSTQYMTLAQILICAATPWIERERVNSMRDVIYYQDNIGQYPFAHLANIRDVPFKNYTQFTYTSYDEPLATKVMTPAVALTWVMPEFNWKVADHKYVLPWYICEEDLDANGNVLADENNMCMPSIRSGVRLGSLDLFYSMSEKDIRLSLDRLSRAFLRNAKFDTLRAYKYGRTTDGQVAVDCDSAIITIGDMIAAPRELGWFMDAPLGVLTVDPEALDSSLAPLSAEALPSFCIKIWTNAKTNASPSILAAAGVNIERAANYTQKWMCRFANGSTSGNELAGLVFAMSDDDGEFEPFAYLGSGAQVSEFATIRSYQRSLNTRLQFLPFVISPFDAVPNADDELEDIYDFAYFFGLCGFRASDYRESTYNREKEVVNQGLLFVSDPWVEASPVFKGGAASTGLAISKGYELK